MTEITFVGDVHSNFSQFVNLTKRKKTTKTFFQVGDFGLFSSIHAAKTDADWKTDTRTNMELFIDLYVKDKIQKFNVPIYFIKGIHDDFNIDKKILATKNIYFLESSGILTINNIRIGYLGGIRSVIKIKRNPETLTGKDRRFFTQQEVDNLKTLSIKQPIDILVTHQAAMGCVPLIHNITHEEGSRELRDLLDDVHPKYYFHGHHHINYANHNEEYPIIIGLGNFGKNKQSFYSLTI